MSEFTYQPIFSKQRDETEYRKLSSSYVSVSRLKRSDNSGVEYEYVEIQPEALTLLSKTAFDDVSHLLRSSHLEKLALILEDEEASSNDRFVALELLRNAVIAAEREFPSCQDTGTAIVMAKRGNRILTDGADEEHLAKGIFDIFQERNLRYSQLAPLDMYTEKNTKTNLPAQIDIYAGEGDKYEFLFIAKGGGSANKTFLYQKSKSLLNPKGLEDFVREAMVNIGTAACPPYHLALVVGGTSAEMNLKTVKLATCGELDNLPTTGNDLGRAFRDVASEPLVEQWARESGIGAQFGGKYFVHDVRVIRLPRHGASCPVGIGVSCSADRQIKGYISREGVFLEQLEEDPIKFLPQNRKKSILVDLVSQNKDQLKDEISIDLHQPMPQILDQLTKLSVATRIILNGPIIVARDIAHAKLKERLDTGEGLPEYLKNHPVYYAGPAKTPTGYASGSFGPTTSQRMDSYVPLFQEQGASLIMLGKGNRSPQVTEACKKFGGFYLGSIGGPAARLGKDCITKVETVEYSELGMEAIWRIEVVDFPAFIIIDDKGNDFFARIRSELVTIKSSV
jgi:fumarate hydratase, class I